MGSCVEIMLQWNSGISFPIDSSSGWEGLFGFRHGERSLEEESNSPGNGVRGVLIISNGRIIFFFVLWGGRGWGTSFFPFFCTRTTNGHIPTEAKSKQYPSMYSDLLAVKIPLGIFITSPNCINEKGCEMLLHYAASGEVVQLKEMQRKAKGCVGHDELTPWSAGDARKWALNGACLVFNLFDLIEDMSVMFFDCEAARVDFLLQMKGKASTYLLKCVKLLFEGKCLEFCNGAIGVRDTMLDLYRRLVQWRQQGSEEFEGCKAFDDIVDDFARRFRIVE